VSAAAELHVVAVVVCVVSADVLARVIAIFRRPMWITRALMVVLAVAAVFPRVVVATTVQKVTAKLRFTLGRVVHRLVVLVTFAINEILADS